jgi:prepilin-type processing-associated H-X9-DG protein/prepilin-type N-terminal cleavage/methylation domain-containing protein
VPVAGLRYSVSKMNAVQTASCKAGVRNRTFRHFISSNSGLPRFEIRTTETITNHAFTAVELLTVVTILGLLASLLLPKLSEAQKKARGLACQNLLRQIGNGLQMYVHDHNSYPPLTDSDTNIVCFEGLYPYYPLAWTNASWNCPTYVAKGGIISRDLVANHSVGISYAYNFLGVSSWSGCPEAIRELHLGLGHLPSSNQKDVGVIVPSEMYAVADARCEVSGIQIAGHIKMSLWSFSGQEAAPLHGKGYNVVFCDGHVSFVNREELLYPPKSAVNWNSDHQPHPEGWAPLTMWAVQK